MKLLKVIGGAAMLLTAGCVTKVKTFGIPNLAEVDPIRNVYRGGQPDGIEGWIYLRDQLGINTVLKLNTDREGSEHLAESLGLTIIRAPLNFWQQIGIQSIPPHYLDDTLQRASPWTNLFIHCEHGEDRTGDMVADYRLRINNWPKDQATQERDKHNFHPILHGLYELWENQRP